MNLKKNLIKDYVLPRCTQLAVKSLAQQHHRHNRHLVFKVKVPSFFYVILCRLDVRNLDENVKEGIIFFNVNVEGIIEFLCSREKKISLFHKKKYINCVVRHKASVLLRTFVFTPFMMCFVQFER